MHSVGTPHFVRMKRKFCLEIDSLGRRVNRLPQPNPMTLFRHLLPMNWNRGDQNNMDAISVPRCRIAASRLASTSDRAMEDAECLISRRYKQV
jgi:hypothetical protein